MNWLLSGYVFLASPSSLRGTAHASVDEMRDERTMSEPPHCLTPRQEAAAPSDRVCAALAAHSLHLITVAKYQCSWLRRYLACGRRAKALLMLLLTLIPGAPRQHFRLKLFLLPLNFAQGFTEFCCPLIDCVALTAAICCLSAQVLLLFCAGVPLLVACVVPLSKFSKFQRRRPD